MRARAGRARRVQGDSRAAAHRGAREIGRDGLGLRASHSRHRHPDKIAKGASGISGQGRVIAAILDSRA